LFWLIETRRPRDTACAVCRLRHRGTDGFRRPCQDSVAPVAEGRHTRDIWSFGPGTHEWDYWMPRIQDVLAWLADPDLTRESVADKPASRVRFARMTQRTTISPAFVLDVVSGDLLPEPCRLSSRTIGSSDVIAVADAPSEGVAGHRLARRSPLLPGSDRLPYPSGGPGSTGGHGYAEVLTAHRRAHEALDGVANAPSDGPGPGFYDGARTSAPSGRFVDIALRDAINAGTIEGPRHVVRRRPTSPAPAAGRRRSPGFAPDVDAVGAVRAAGRCVWSTRSTMYVARCDA